MSTVQEIERAIDALTAPQRDELFGWVDERYLQPIDVQLERDLNAGRMDGRINRALVDHRSGRTQPL